MSKQQKRIIVAGGRKFRNYELLKRKLDYYLHFYETDPKTEIIIVSGGADGADALGEKYAEERGYKVESHPANWYPNGKGAYLGNGTYEGLDRSAGHKRNAEMANVGNCLVAFWDGKSTGTQGMINMARNKGLQVVVVKYKK